MKVTTINEQSAEIHSEESQYSTEVLSLNDGRVLRFRLLLEGRPLSWSDIIRRWQNDESFRRFYMSIFADAPFAAYFWETPPVTRATINQIFEFVLVEARQLAGVPADQKAFADQFTSAGPGESVVEFSNLGGDALLVVPCPLGPPSAYSQIASFTRQAPDDQQHRLWQRVGTAIERQLGVEPVWLNTSGTGIYWLHIRLDSTPKYYTYEHYRTA